MPQNQLHTLTHMCSHFLTVTINNSFSSIHKSQKTITTSQQAEVDQHGDVTPEFQWLLLKLNNWFSHSASQGFFFSLSIFSNLFHFLKCAERSSYKDTWWPSKADEKLTVQWSFTCFGARAWACFCLLFKKQNCRQYVSFLSSNLSCRVAKLLNVDSHIDQTALKMLLVIYLFCRSHFWESLSGVMQLISIFSVLE